MKKFASWVLLIIALIVGAFSADPAFAKTIEDYVDEAYALMDQRQYTQALSLLQETYIISPEIALVFPMGECYHNLGQYEKAIANYLQVFKQVAEFANNAPVFHYNLMLAYYALGQIHYFSPELCLRIIYHVQKIFELASEERNPEYMGFLCKIIGHYDVASMGTGVRMMEEGGDGQEFTLPDDGISEEIKQQYLKRARENIADLETSERASRYQTSPSDKSLAAFMDLFAQKLKGMRSVHYKKSGDRTEEVKYAYPDRAVLYQEGAVNVMKDGKISMYNSESGGVLREQEFDFADADMLNALLIPNLPMLERSYDMTVEKVDETPDFLAPLYEGGMEPHLYLITGILKKGQDGPFYPTVGKLEYFIDTGLGLAVGERQYWLGVLGSGKKHELAMDMTALEVQQPEEGMYFPKTGLTKGHAPEVANLHDEWTVEVLSVGKRFADSEFVPAKHVRSGPGLAMPDDPKETYCRYMQISMKIHEELTEIMNEGRGMLSRLSSSEDPKDSIDILQRHRERVAELKRELQNEGGPLVFKDIQEVHRLNIASIDQTIENF